MEERALVGGPCSTQYLLTQSWADLPRIRLRNNVYITRACSWAPISTSKTIHRVVQVGYCSTEVRSPHLPIYNSSLSTWTLRCSSYRQNQVGRSWRTLLLPLHRQQSPRHRNLVLLHISRLTHLRRPSKSSPQQPRNTSPLSPHLGIISLMIPYALTTVPLITVMSPPGF